MAHAILAPYIELKTLCSIDFVFKGGPNVYFVWVLYFIYFLLVHWKLGIMLNMEVMYCVGIIVQLPAVSTIAELYDWQNKLM